MHDFPHACPSSSQPRHNFGASFSAVQRIQRIACQLASSWVASVIQFMHPALKRSSRLLVLEWLVQASGGFDEQGVALGVAVLGWK